MSDKRTYTVRNYIDAIVALVIALCLTMSLLHYSRPIQQASKIQQLDDGWSVETHGKTFTNVTLSKSQFGMCNRDDVMTLTRVIDVDETLKNPVLYCYSVHSTVDIFLDNEQIFTYGHDLYEANKLLGYGAHYVQLPIDYSGKTLKIVFHVTENKAFDGVPMLSIQNGATAIPDALASHRINLAITLFLIVFGILGMFLSILLFGAISFRKTFCISAFAFLVGSWVLCNSDLITLLNSNLRLKVYMEYITFYTVLLPFLGYFYDSVMIDGVPKKIKISYNILIWGDLLLTVFIFLCQICNWIHFPFFVSIQHGAIALGMAFAIWMNGVEKRRYGRKFTYLSLGLGIGMVVVACELIRYNLRKYVIGFSDNRYNSMIQIMSLIVVASLLADFIHSVAKNLYEKAQNELLRKIAYVDELTGLFNRRRCNELMDELKQDYRIIGLDMNDLKHINDTYGHDMGDKFLMALANILNQSFPKEATIGRMGGDEFIVILPDVSESDTNQYIAVMKQLIAKYNNKKETPFALSVAYGVASFTEGKTPHEVYKKADARMYEEKKQMKAQMES